MSPEEFKTEFLEFIISAGFYPVISPWQIDVANRMMNDYAIATGQSITDTGPILSDICESCPAPIQKTNGWGCKANKKEEIPMASYASAQIIADTTEKDQRRFAGDRLVTIFYDKKAALKKQFGLVDDDAPKSAAEFIKRITDGMYTVDKEKMDREIYDAARYIRWRDPSKVEDKAGYDAAKKALEDAYTKAKDKVALGAAADLLAAVEAFDGWTLS